ncbi:MAG TPA: hypothetical protein VF795_05975 [Desulfuromonadaceae bacterium]
MSIWSKFAGWYKEKKVLVHDNHPTMPSFSIEDVSSSSAKTARKVVGFISRNWIGLMTTIGVGFTAVGAIYAVKTFHAPPPQAPPQNKPQTAAPQPKAENTEKIIPKEIHKQSPSVNQQLPDKSKSVAAFAAQSSSTKPQSQQNSTTPNTARVPTRIIGKKITVSIGGEPPKDDPDEVVGESIRVHVPDSEIGKHQKVIGEEVNVTVGSPKK